NAAIVGSGSSLVAILGRRLPDHSIHDAGISDAWEAIAERAKRFIRSETELLTAVREFAGDFEEPWLIETVRSVEEHGDRAALVHAIGLAIHEARKSVSAIYRAAEAQA
ncbi:MAG TPA: hypothetical protein VMA53_09020, partial [Stellaceae bacterium]|nr:hypothetical protein [Stellaceae bacterium]